MDISSGYCKYFLYNIYIHNYISIGTCNMFFRVHIKVKYMCFEILQLEIYPYPATHLIIQT